MKLGNRQITTIAASCVTPVYVRQFY